MPERRADFMSGKAIFCSNALCLARKINAAWRKIRRRYGVLNYVHSFLYFPCKQDKSGVLYSGGDCMHQNEPTISFSIHEDKDREMRSLLTQVYNALIEKGYNPINQIVGYILSEDPTYITTHNNARSLIRRIDRDDLLHALVKNYLGEEEAQ